MDKLDFLNEYIKKCVIYDFSDVEILENRNIFSYSHRLDNFECFLNSLENIRFKSGMSVYNFYFNQKNKKAIMLKECELRSQNADIGQTHYEFITEIGEILDFYNIDDRDFLVNIGNIFISNKFQTGLAEYNDDYICKCNKEKIKPVESLMQLKLLGLESNGNFIMYDDNEELFKYASDDIYNDFLIQVKDVPKQTFYKLKNINNISELLSHIKAILE